MSASITITLDGLHIVSLLGAIQGFCLTAVLALRRRNRTANRLLAALMFSLSIELLTSVYYSTGLIEVWPHFFGVAYPLPLLYGPLVYLYVVHTSDRRRPVGRRDALHFVPFGAVVIAGLPNYLLNGAAKIAFAHAVMNGDAPLLIQVVDPLKVLSGASYTVATILLLRSHLRHVKDSYSSLERVNLRWLLWLAGSAAAIWLVAVISQLTETFGAGPLKRADDMINLAIALLMYGIGYMALRQPEIFRYETAEYPAAVAPPAAAATAEEAPRYERSGLGDREAEALKTALLALMDRDRPWQKSEITLADLAGMLSTTPHRLSEVLNAQLDQTFYDFVNSYRVRDVQRRIKQGESRNLTLLSLALDAGFASKSTFNDVFKKQTGSTPSDYRRSATAS